MALPAYHPSMKLGRIQLVASVALLASLLCVPGAMAQRGGGRGGGGMAAHGGGMGARGMSAGRPAPAFRSGYAARTAYSRPAFYSGRGNGIRVTGRGGYGLRYPVVPYYPYGYGLGWDDSGLNSGLSGVYDPTNGAAGYPDVLSPGRAYSDPGIGPYAPQTNQIAPAPEEAVTLIFKDGRAPLQVHNYALTRTMLYVTDAHHRDIPVAELDLDATQKVNAEAGMNFQLPTPN